MKTAIILTSDEYFELVKELDDALVALDNEDHLTARLSIVMRSGISAAVISCVITSTIQKRQSAHMGYVTVWRNCFLRAQNLKRRGASSL